MMNLLEINPDLEKLLQIRYIKLRFQIEFLEEGNLPQHKTSALRGGMGEMLLRQNCIRNRECEKCDFQEECIVQRTMYSKSKNKPSFVTTGDSIGYILECTDQRTEVEAGDCMEFSLSLFGRTIVYFNQYLQALHALGMNGIAKEELHFRIINIYNSRNQPILDGNNIYMENYKIETVADYVNYRLRYWNGRVLPKRWKLVFDVPFSMKSYGKQIYEFDAKTIYSAIVRRIYMFNMFEDQMIDEATNYYEEEKNSELNMVFSKAYTITVPRYSFRKSQKMYLKGICGQAQFEQVSMEQLAVFYAGELLHIGKGTSFGFGRYHCVPVREMVK